VQQDARLASLPAAALDAVFDVEHAAGASAAQVPAMLDAIDSAGD
jgi:hypothetical protein